MMKLEKTCTCIEHLDASSICPEVSIDHPAENTLSFIERHEYQVDVYVTLDANTYRVYNNGGWTDYIDIDEEAFSKHFRLID